MSVKEIITDSKILFRLLIGGSTVRSSEKEKKTIPRKTVFLSTTYGCWKVNPKSESCSKVIEVVPNVSSQFVSYNPENLDLIAVNATGSYSKEEVQYLFELELDEVVKTGPLGDYVAGLAYKGVTVASRDKARISEPVKYFKVDPLGLSSELRERLCILALDEVGLLAVPFPAHPSWIMGDSQEAIFYCLICKEGDMFADMVTEANGGIPLSEQETHVLRLRAGKDISKGYITELEKFRLLVFKESLSERIVNGTKVLDSDGIVYVRRSKLLKAGEHALYKGTSTSTKKKHIVKARFLHAPAQAGIGHNGKRIPKTIDGQEIDGWTSESNLKWVAVDFPEGANSVVLEVEVGISTAEMHESKEAYKVNLFYAVLGSWGKRTEDCLYRLLTSNAKRVARNISDLREFLVRRIEGGLQSDMEEVMSDSYLSKLVTGLLSSNDRHVQAALDRVGKGFMSAYAKGSVYVAIAHREYAVVDGGKVVKVRDDEIIPTKDVRKALEDGAKVFGKLTGKSLPMLTGVRYPNTTPGSFIGFRLSKHTLDDVSGMFCIVGLAAQIGWQSDCDDHALLLPCWESKVSVYSFDTIEKHVRPADGKLSPWTAYHHGAVSQGLVGPYVAEYMKFLSFIYDYVPEKLGEAIRLVLHIAQAIQALVQGVKKFTMPSISLNGVYSLSEHLIGKLIGRVSFSPTASVISGKMAKKGKLATLAAAVDHVYGVSIPDKLDTSGWTCEALRKLKMSTAGDFVVDKAFESALEGHPHLNAVDVILKYFMGYSREELAENEEIIETLDPERLVQAIVIYSKVVLKMHEAGRIDKVKSMNGLPVLFAEEYVL